LAVEEHTFAMAEQGSITVSSGIATFPEDGDDPISLLLASDRALYQAKANGRNRVEVHQKKAA